MDEIYLERNQQILATLDQTFMKREIKLLSEAFRQCGFTCARIIGDQFELRDVLELILKARTTAIRAEMKA